MKGYLGCEPVTDLKDTPYNGYTPTDWAMRYLGKYGQIDGAHHKAWVLDHIARILKGTEVEVPLAKWDNGHSEYRFSLKDPSKEYMDWIEWMKSWNEEECEYEYDYTVGIAP